VSESKDQNILGLYSLYKILSKAGPRTDPDPGCKNTLSQGGTLGGNQNLLCCYFPYDT
jgi:hypothetical protein